MAAAGAAIAAMAAGDMTFARYAVARMEAAHLTAQFDDLAGILMTDRHGNRYGLLGPSIPIVNVHVGAADGRTIHFDEDIIVTDRGFRNILHPDAGFRARLDQCFHELPLEPGSRMTPRSRAARPNAEMT